MNRRHFLSLSAAICAALPLYKIAEAAEVAATSAKGVSASQKNGSILYAQGRSLFLQNPDGAAPREFQLALPKAADPTKLSLEMVSLSDDGKRIAFRADGAIYTANSDGSGLTLLAAADGTTLSYPSLSADGKWVACGHDRIHYPLTLLSETGEAKNLDDSTLEANTVRFARDGKTVFFNANSHLKRIPVEGGEANTILRGHYIEEFDVGPDGRLIAAIPWDNTLVRLGIVDANGNKEYLSPKADEYHSPTWSPDGRFIAFSKRARYGSNPAKGIYILTLADQTIEQISDQTINPMSGLMWR